MVVRKEGKKEATPLSVMLGAGAEFEAAEKKYIVKPLKLKDVYEFLRIISVLELSYSIY
jgi:hypothetical protein